MLRKQKDSSFIGWMVQADGVSSSMASKYCALTLQSKSGRIVHDKNDLTHDDLSFPPPLPDNDMEVTEEQLKGGE